MDQEMDSAVERQKTLAACQQEINDSQQHHHEGIDKEPAISQHENVTENYGSHPHNNQSRSQSGCLWDQQQNRYHRFERPRPQPEYRLRYQTRGPLATSGRTGPPNLAPLQ